MATPTVPRTASGTVTSVAKPGSPAPDAEVPPHHSRVRTALTGLFLLLVTLFGGYPDSIAGTAAWWALDSGPLAGHPRDVLTETSPTGAVRVYGDHPGEDADLAATETVDALEDAGGFDRRYLSVDLPTGSGWVDPDQVEGIEQWAEGDVASVSVRYSSAPSAAVLLMHRDLAEASADALLHEVVDRVAQRPADQRPEVIVHGQSLGALVGADVLADDPALRDAVSAVLWQGMPGGASDRDSTDRDRTGNTGGTAADRCTVSELNDDDPVGQLSPALLTHPVEAVRVLTDLPGSEHRAVGSGHSYGAVLPPADCLG